jgi:CAP12/Pycsar effector protein, TIR domain/Domain of unknown function (DUF4062)
MTSTVNKIRIFAASPGDVCSERESLKRVVDELNTTVAPDKDIVLELVRWETHCQPGMGRPQGLINNQIGKYDIFVGVMWKRFGTPTGEAESGTEEEFRLAYKSWSGNEAPLIKFYFNQEPFMPRTEVEIMQLSKVLQFKNEIQESGLVWEYPNSLTFPDVIRPHLYRSIIEITENTDSRQSAPSIAQKEKVNNVYLAYGTDVKTGLNLKCLLSLKGFNVISLREEANQGLTIIEKFDRATESVTAAIVVLSPDDVGRARQNTVLELGYLLAKLGRRNVIILSEMDMEYPSDIMGSIYIQYKRNIESVYDVLLNELRLLGLKEK